MRDLTAEYDGTVNLAVKGDGKHFVPLDAAIETMRQTGADMHEKYKETALGGLVLADGLAQLAGGLVHDEGGLSGG